jgi:hypothetical protein
MIDQTYIDKRSGPSWAGNSSCSATCDCAECYKDGMGKFSEQGPPEPDFFRGAE